MKNLNNKMLPDGSIDLAQRLLKKQVTIIGGLQVIAPSEHRSENNTCFYLDSLSRGKITKIVEKKICALLLCWYSNKEME